MRKAVFLLTCVTLLHGLPARAQRIDHFRLQAADREFPEPFSQISGLRELSDRRLLIADRQEKTLRSINLRTGESRELGRVGGGPGEYQTPGELLPLPGDSTLMVDFANLRMSVIAPSGRIVRSSPLMRTDLFVRPAGTDAKGRVYFEMSSFTFSSSSSGQIEIPDSAAVARWDTQSDRIDTVGYVKLPTRSRQAEGIRIQGGNIRLRGGSVLSRAFPTQDVWAVTADGQIAFVRADDYHVEWVDERGQKTVGPRVEHEPVPVHQEDKEAWADRMSSRSGMMILAGGSGGGSRSIRMPRPNIDEIEWPDVKPPFPRQAARVTPEGKLWVERHGKLGEPQTFDVFDSRGIRTKQVVLPAGRRLVGFGRGVLFAIRTDDDDLQWLEQYRR